MFSVLDTMLWGSDSSFTAAQVIRSPTRCPAPFQRAFRLGVGAATSNFFPDIKSQVIAGGATFGGGNASAKTNPYPTGASQTAADMAAMMNGKYASESLSHPP